MRGGCLLSWWCGSVRDPCVAIKTCPTCPKLAKNQNSKFKITTRAMAESKNYYLICYDIRDPKRWRKAFKLLKGYGENIQF